MLDGTRRGLKKTGSSLSASLAPSPSILSSWRGGGGGGLRKSERGRDMDVEEDRKIDGDGWRDSQRKIECCLKGSGPGEE